MSEESPKRRVFRIVDGELMHIPGDVRDPARLYRSVANVTTGDQYDVELTEQEEAERRAQSAAWEADAPKREAEAKDREREAREFRESLAYEQRIVAFIDVLGWRSAIENSVQDSALTHELGIALSVPANAGRFLRNLATMGPDGKWYGDPQITHFSDSVLLSVQDGRHAESLLTQHLWWIVGALLQLGFVLRGGIARGALIHRAAMAYGPALNAAYDLEHEDALYPRIILEEQLAKAWGDGSPAYDREGKLLGRSSVWRKDKDGRYFYDFLQPIPLTPGVNNAEELFRSHLGPIRNMIENRLKQHTDERVRKKYLWCAAYFNDFCAEHARYIQPIAVDGPGPESNP